jgi:hypothetical protein
MVQKSKSAVLGHGWLLKKVKWLESEHSPSLHLQDASLVNSSRFRFVIQAPDVTYGIAIIIAL